MERGFDYDAFFQTLMDWTDDELKEHKGIDHAYPWGVLSFCNSWLKSGTRGIIAIWDTDEEDDECEVDDA